MTKFFEAGEAERLLAASERGELPDDRGRFGPFGGRYIPETLVSAFERLEEGVRRYLPDPEFQDEFQRELRDWVGRPTALTHAPRLSERWGVDVWLKREDLAHTGAHKINNAIGQALLAKRLGVQQVIAETGAGQHGVASAAACARVGLPCRVYMGAVDIERQAPNVDRMQRLGAEVVAVETGDKTLRAAIDEAMRDWVGDPAGTYYLLGSAVGPHPYPYLVRELQSVIGEESKRQMRELAGGLPDAVFACVGGGSNAIGMFYPFVKERDVQLIGVEAGGTGSGFGAERSDLGDRHARGAARLLLDDFCRATMGRCRRRTQYPPAWTIPVSVRSTRFLQAVGRVRYVAAGDDEALSGLEELCACEGILTALETAHAYAAARRWAKDNPGKRLLIGNSGRGDKDMPTLTKYPVQVGLHAAA